MKGRFIEPKVILLAETKINEDGLSEFLNFLGVPAWASSALSDAEELCEIAGKLCYMSFSTDLNKNLTKVGTRSNEEYLQEGIIATKHGSVLEHPTVSLALMNVSRVVTHELIRHRAGAAYSQVSGRYVRTDAIDFYLPDHIKANKAARDVFVKAVTAMEDNVAELARIYDVDNMRTKEGFTLKKILTSAFRRLVGNGQANHIICSYNHRALRHLIELRTDGHAEEEIRKTFAQVFLTMRSCYPAIYKDAMVELVADIPQVTFKHSKV